MTQEEPSSSSLTAASGAELAVEALINAGVDTLFALPGIQLDQLFCALHDRSEHIRVVHARHEQGAAYMAFGYAEATGRVGAYTVVPGPGFLNTAAALSTAYACHSPVLAIIGQIESGRIGLGGGELHEIRDQTGIIQRLTRWNALVRDAREAPAAIAAAVESATARRMRPVAVELPPDVLAARPPAAPATTAKRERIAASTPDPDEIARFSEMLLSARRPLMFIGRGAVHAAAEVRELVRRLQIPTVCEGRAKGIIDDRDVLSVGLYGARYLWRDSDLIVAVGSRARHALYRWKIGPAQKFIRIDIDQSLVDARAPDAAVSGDSRLALQAVLDRLGDANEPRENRTKELTEIRRRRLETFENVLPAPLRYLRAMRAALPDDGLLVSEYTQLGYLANAIFPTFSEETIITPGYQGTLGFGFATALGAKVGQPHRPVLSINGDGGFLFTATELATAVKHRIGVIAVVFNDGYFSNVRRMQVNIYGQRKIATDLHNPDFVAFARSFGARGVRANDELELGTAIRSSLGRNIPTVIEVPIGQLPDPWPLLRPALADLDCAEIGAAGAMKRNI